MKMEIVAIRDAKLEQFNEWRFVPTLAMIIRAFEEQCENPQTDFYKYPEDYTLFHLGHADMVDPSKSELFAQPIPIAHATSFQSTRHKSDPDLARTEDLLANAESPEDVLDALIEWHKSQGRTFNREEMQEILLAEAN